MVKPDFWKQPIKYLRYCSHEQPTIFWTLIIGLSGPALAVGATPLRRKFLFEDAPPIPLTYPLPNRPRDASLTGYDD